MIPNRAGAPRKESRKPRASGDDPRIVVTAVDDTG